MQRIREGLPWRQA